jgi:hypothetical protein
MAHMPEQGRKKLKYFYKLNINELALSIKKKNHIKKIIINKLM